MNNTRYEQQSRYEQTLDMNNTRYEQMLDMNKHQI